jgi:hypothetical protein
LGQFSTKATKMANISPATQAIDSITQCLAAACEAARRLDTKVSGDLRSLLHIAGGEAERVRKAARKARMSKKPVSKSAKSPAKRERAAAAKMAPQQAKSRRRVSANGAAAH